MPMTQQEIESFTRFAEQRLHADDSALSLEDCLRLWREQRERTQTIEDVRQGLADYAAGRAEPLDRAFNDIRGELGLTK
jgi:hypothetical protein